MAYGEETLAIELNRHPGVAKQLVRLGLQIVQDGDHKKTFVFSVDRFDAVAEIVKPRKRRQVSEAERQRLAAMSARHGFRPLHQPEQNPDAPRAAETLA